MSAVRNQICPISLPSPKYTTEQTAVCGLFDPASPIRSSQYCDDQSGPDSFFVRRADITSLSQIANGSSPSNGSNSRTGVDAGPYTSGRVAALDSVFES